MSPKAQSTYTISMSSKFKIIKDQMYDLPQLCVSGPTISLSLFPVYSLCNSNSTKSLTQSDSVTYHSQCAIPYIFPPECNVSNKSLINCWQKLQNSTLRNVSPLSLSVHFNHHHVQQFHLQFQKKLILNLGSSSLVCHIWTKPSNFWLDGCW